MWSRKRLDIGWSDLLFGACKVFAPPNRDDAARNVEKLWPEPENTLACLSVRTGFDLLLGALDLPRGSEVLVSALTIPDMVRIVERHGLVPVPVDIEPRHMAPTLEQWQRAITPATRLVLAAHLFGGQADMEPLLALARWHKLLVVEDCAQAFAGLGYQGHPRADVSMFSFGTIKRCTALGGAILRVRDADLLARMRTAGAAYPVQRRRAYLKRLVKCAAMKSICCQPVCGLIVRVCRTLGADYDRWVNRAARGFPGDDFFGQIRRCASAALLAVLERRLLRHDLRRLERHVEKGAALAAALRPSVDCPGAMVEPHTYWVFPILAELPDRLLEHLAKKGFDATQGQSLCVVGPPADRADRTAVAAEELLTRVVFLPFYPEMPAGEMNRMSAAVLECATSLRGGT